jgi:hypothetical protein
VGELVAEPSALSRHLRHYTEENHVKLSQDSRWPAEIWSRYHLKSEALPSEHICSYNFNPSKVESESYVTTDGQSATLSWNKAPIWGLRPDSYRRLTVASVLMWGALSNESLQLLLTLASAVILGSESRGTSDHILLSQIRDFPFRRLPRLAGLRWRYSTRLHTGFLKVEFLLNST